MPRICTVCSHESRAEIDRHLATGTLGDAAIAKRYGLQPGSVGRHRKAHVPKLLASIADRVGMLETDQVMAQVVSLYERSLDLLAQAESRVLLSSPIDHHKAIGAAASAIREARHTLETLARVNLVLRSEAMGVSEDATDSRPDLDAAVESALARRGLLAQGARVTDWGNPSQPMTVRALPSPSQVEDAEIVEE